MISLHQTLDQKHAFLEETVRSICIYGELSFKTNNTYWQELTKPI